MREIKFRIWAEGNGTAKKRIMVLVPLEEMNLLKVNPSSIVMQFTGLHDKNGEEIYEGDIVKHQYAGNQIVYWFHNGWSIKDNIEDDDYLPSYEDWDYVTVIGNIYENPELLESN